MFWPLWVFLKASSYAERMLAKDSKLPALFLTPGGNFAKGMGQKPSPAWCLNAPNKSKCPASLLLTAVLGPTGILLLGPPHSTAIHFCFPAGCCAICILLKGCPATHGAGAAWIHSKHGSQLKRFHEALSHACLLLLFVRLLVQWPT